jgi:hypothetical protein
MPADRDGILRLAQAAHAESAFGVFPFDPAKFDVAFEAAMSHPKSQVGVVVELDGRVLGFGFFRCGPHYLSSEGLLATVQALCVDAGVRRSLLGGRVLAKLLRALERWSEAVGARATTIAVTSGHDADGLRRRLGRAGWEVAGPTLLRLRRETRGGTGDAG